MGGETRSARILPSDGYFERTTRSPVRMSAARIALRIESLVMAFSSLSSTNVNGAAHRYVFSVSRRCWEKNSGLGTVRMGLSIFRSPQTRPLFFPSI